MHISTQRLLSAVMVLPQWCNFELHIFLICTNKIELFCPPKLHWSPPHYDNLLQGAWTNVLCPVRPPPPPPPSLPSTNWQHLVNQWRQNLWWTLWRKLSSAAKCKNCSHTLLRNFVQLWVVCTHSSYPLPFCSLSFTLISFISTFLVAVVTTYPFTHYLVCCFIVVSFYLLHILLFLFSHTFSFLFCYNLVLFSWFSLLIICRCLLSVTLGNIDHLRSGVYTHPNFLVHAANCLSLLWTSW